MARGLIIAWAIAAALPGAGGAKYYLCAFTCPGCDAPWASCRPEPCDAALAEDACVDGDDPRPVPLRRLVENATADGLDATEMVVAGPGACLDVLGLATGGNLGSFAERCSLAAGLARGAGRALAEGSADVNGAESLCAEAERRAAKSLRAQRTCRLDRGYCKGLLETLRASTCHLAAEAASAGAPARAELRARQEAQSGAVLSTRVDARGEPLCGAPRAATVCTFPRDLTPIVAGVSLAAGAALVVVQHLAFRRYKTVSTVNGFLPAE